MSICLDKNVYTYIDILIYKCEENMRQNTCVYNLIHFHLN